MKKTMLCMLAMVAGMAGADTSVPLKQVVLYNSGVGYFERQAQVEGDSSAVLQFPLSQINDVIKSLVLSDEGGGSIGAVTYDARDPVERTLKTYRVDLSDNPNRVTLFNRLRGVAVKVKVSGSDYDGHILGVEERAIFKGDDQVVREAWLNLSGASGLKSVRFEDVQSLQFTDDAIRDDLAAALNTLAGSLDRDKKNLKLTFKGKGKRPVMVGYMLETPVWKTSYRMVVEDQKLFLQGWAHVENVTDEDWNEVRLSLVSGRPISFIQNLYDPIYVQRPVVQMDLHGAVAPQQYGRAMGGAGVADADLEMMPAESEPNMVMAFAAAPAPASRRMSMKNLAESGVQAAAEGESAGELFQYAIEDLVTLPRQQSALIPIVNAGIKGAPLSIFSRNAGSKHPLNGIEVENSSKLFLMQGPVSVFEEGIYAGDARLRDTRPLEKVLISYSLDLATEVRVETESEPEQITSVKIDRGTMILQKRYVSTTKYVVSSQREDERALLIEQPMRTGWNLLEPQKDVEKTVDFYRFRLQLAPGKTRELLAKEQRVGDQRVQLSNLNQNFIGVYLQQKDVPENIKVALRKLSNLQGQLAAIQAEKTTVDQQIQRITQEQVRIRENMKTVDRTSEVYGRWERKLAQQEDELESLAARLEQLGQNELKKQQEINEYLSGLTVG